MVCTALNKQWSDEEDEATVVILLGGDVVSYDYAADLGISHAGLRKFYYDDYSWNEAVVLEDREAFLTALRAKWGEARVLKILLEMEEAS